MPREPFRRKRQPLPTQKQKRVATLKPGLSASRRRVYAALEKRIGNTPLYQVRRIPVPNGCKIFVKEEYRNPSGSHYDRVYLGLLKALETEGRIIPGKTPLIETSSGNAGISFAWLAKKLGFSSEVIMPANLPSARVEGARVQGAKIRLSPAKKYVGGAAEMLRAVLTVENKQRAAQGLPKYWSPNHSQDPRTAIVLRPIADEVKRQLGNTKLDFLVVGVGNGATILGPGKRLKELFPGLKVVAWEPFSSARMYSQMHGGQYEKMFGINPGEKIAHTVYGTGVPNVEFPLLQAAQRTVVDDVKLVAQQKELASHKRQLRGRKQAAQFISNASSLIRWENTLDQLHSIEKKLVGRSSAGSLAVALEMASRVKNKNFLIIFYDKISRY